MLSRYIIFILIWLVYSIDLMAQEPILIRSGMRVRVTAPTVRESPITGKIAQVNAKTMIIQAEQPVERFNVPIAALTRLEVSRGRSAGRPILGAVIGLLGGGLLGVGYGAAGHPGLPHVGSDVPQAQEYAFQFAFGGMLAGTIIGLATNKERWQEVPIDEVHFSEGKYGE